jgi:hypothetical protein
MAKMNWEKNRRNHALKEQIVSQAKENSAKADYYYLLEKGLWPVKGIHKGKPIKSLDTSYLEFIAKNFNGEVRELALNELRIRQNTARNKIKALRQDK